MLVQEARYKCSIINPDRRLDIFSIASKRRDEIALTSIHTMHALFLRDEFVIMMRMRVGSVPAISLRLLLGWMVARRGHILS